MLLAGHTIQQYLYSIVIRFRTYQITFTADIAKMCYRVEMHQYVRYLRRILWWKSH